MSMHAHDTPFKSVPVSTWKYSASHFLNFCTRLHKKFSCVSSCLSSSTSVRLFSLMAFLVIDRSHCLFFICLYWRFTRELWRSKYWLPVIRFVSDVEANWSPISWLISLFRFFFFHTPWPVDKCIGKLPYYYVQYSILISVNFSQ